MIPCFREACLCYILFQVQILLLVLALAAPPRALAEPDPINGPDLLTQAAELYAHGNWKALAELISEAPSGPAQMDYYRGMALARLGRSDKARLSFEAGAHKAPLDKRFPLELAGLAFQSRHFSQAKSLLFQALALDPQDAYAQEFLASLYFLEGNLEAALKYWNQVGKPEIDIIEIDPSPRLKPELLDRAFLFSRASLLRLQDLESSRARIDLLGIFPQYRFELLARSNDKFDLAFRPVEANKLGDGWLDSLFSIFKGVPAQTVYVHAHNLNERALNVTSLYRWHAQKRRVFLEVSGVLGGEPRWRHRWYCDLRKENWALEKIFQGPAPSGDLRLQTQQAGLEILSVVSGKWTWKTGIELTHRRFQNHDLDTPAAERLFSQGISLKYRLGVNHTLASIPERRFTLSSFSSAELARGITRDRFNFARLQAGLQTLWWPRPSGDDYAFSLRFRGGKGVGALPFDELFMLGMEQENDLQLRGHAGSHHGKKGTSYLGKDYLLLNVEIDKVVYNHSSFTLKAGPLLDVGKTFDEAQRFASPRWLWDPGFQAKVRLRGGSTAALSWARDLYGRSGAVSVSFSK